MATETQAQKCERCLADGLEPDEDCPFYGEPNGCNSPTYGEYPPPRRRGMSETIADICAAMRYGSIPKHRTDNELLCLYADRIEAAYKRETQKRNYDARKDFDYLPLD